MGIKRIEILKRISIRLFIIFVLLVFCIGIVLCNNYYGFNVLALNEVTNEEKPYNFKVEYNEKNYDILICYKYIINQNSNVTFAYKILFDSTYYETVDNKEDVIKSFNDCFLNTVFTTSFDVNNGYVFATAYYDDISKLYLQNGITGFDENEVNYKKIQKNIFSNDTVSKSKTVFNDINKEGTIINKIYQNCLNNNLVNDNILFNYIYEAPYSERSLQTNADEQAKDEENFLYKHTFYLTVNNYDRDIYFYRHTINNTVVYCFLIGFSIIIMIPIILIYIKRRKKNG